ncbi:MAG: hypothetical protein HY898_25900 [Deltaproteobacteria bacterium]|nr:hypothetical protein [Deltaproteobacteria bacterium]
MISIRGTARPWAWLAIGSAAMVWVASCSSKSTNAPPSDPFICEDGGPSCGAGATGTITPPKDSGSADTGADADIETATITASVIKFLDSDFSEATSTLYKGVATVSMPVPTGQLDYPYGGDAGLDINATNVIVGPAWYQVRPTGDPDLMTTHSFLTLDSDQASIAIPVIDRVLLSTLYVQSAQAAPLDANAGQIIVRFYSSLGVAVSGVKITYSPFSGNTSVTMYDTGPGGNFAVDLKGSIETGTNGTVIISNVTDGFGQLTYTYKTVEYKTPTIAWVKPQATFARITIPQ